MQLMIGVGTFNDRVWKAGGRCENKREINSRVFIFSKLAFSVGATLFLALY